MTGRQIQNEQKEMTTTEAVDLLNPWQRILCLQDDSIVSSHPLGYNKHSEKISTTD